MRPWSRFCARSRYRSETAQHDPRHNPSARKEVWKTVLRRRSTLLWATSIGICVRAVDLHFRAFYLGSAALGRPAGCSLHSRSSTITFGGTDFGTTDIYRGSRPVGKGGSYAGVGECFL